MFTSETSHILHKSNRWKLITSFVYSRHLSTKFWTKLHEEWICSTPTQQTLIGYCTWTHENLAPSTHIVTSAVAFYIACIMYWYCIESVHEQKQNTKIKERHEWEHWQYLVYNGNNKQSEELTYQINGRFE